MAFDDDLLDEPDPILDDADLDASLGDIAGPAFDDLDGDISMGFGPSKKRGRKRKRK